MCYRNATNMLFVCYLYVPYMLPMLRSEHSLDVQRTKRTINLLGRMLSMCYQCAINMRSICYRNACCVLLVRYQRTIWMLLMRYHYAMPVQRLWSFAIDSVPAINMLSECLRDHLGMPLIICDRPVLMCYQDANDALWCLPHMLSICYRNDVIMLSTCQMT